MRSHRHALVAALIVATVAVGAPSPAVVAVDEDVTLTLLHDNGGESSLLPLTNEAGDGTTVSVGGIAAFASVAARERADARERGHSVLHVSAGDSFLASPTLACSRPQDPGMSSLPADAIAQSHIPYDVHVFGNHEFDYGPDFLQRFIFGFVGDTGVEQPFISANLDFSGEPGWSAWIDADGVVETPVTDSRIVGRSAIVTDEFTRERFGVVGATTPMLPEISSPRGVVVAPDMATTVAAVQAEIDTLARRGIDRVILVSHLEDMVGDRALVGLLTNVDVVVSGGGDELLANDASELLAGDDPDGIAGPYPLTVTDAAGRDVPLVTTTGKYRYLGRLDVRFDADGEAAEVVAETTGPQRVIPSEQDGDALTAVGISDAVPSDPELVTAVVDGLAACLGGLAATVGAGKIDSDR